MSKENRMESGSPVQVVNVSGDHFQIGYQHGQQVAPLRNYVLTAMEARFKQLAADGADSAFDTLVNSTIQVLQSTDPATINLIRGLAKGLALPFDRLLRYNLVAFLRDALTTSKHPDKETSNHVSEGCTTWAATGSATADNHPILAKNRDYNLEHLPVQIVVRAKPAKGYQYTFVTSAGSPGVFVAGFNQAGLALVDTHVPTPDVGPGLPTYALSMHILEEHRTVRSALAYLQSTPRLGRNNLLLADAGGDTALFEIGHRHCAILEADAGLLINTNHFNSEVMRPYFVDTDPKPLRGNTFNRYETIKTALNSAYGYIDIALGQRLMAHHAGPLDSVCRHPNSYADTNTISAALFLPVQRRMLFCHGQPCQGTYRSFDYTL